MRIRLCLAGGDRSGFTLLELLSRTVAAEFTGGDEATWSFGGSVVGFAASAASH